MPPSLSPLPPISLSPPENFLLAGVSAVGAKSLIYPLERTQLILRMDYSLFPQMHPEVWGIKVDPHTGQFPSNFSILRELGQKRGVKFFWQGALSTCTKYASTHASYFMLNEFYLQFLTPPDWTGLTANLIGCMLAGGAAGATSQAIVYPFKEARRRLIADSRIGATRQYTGTFDCLIKTIKTNGWGKGGVYNGFTIHCTGVVVYRSLYFGLYNTLKRTESMRTAGWTRKFALAYGTTVTATFLSFPLDVIRRRMLDHQTNLNAPRFSSSFECVRHMVKQEGPFRLFHGFRSTLIIRSFAASLILPMFDAAKMWYTHFK